ncbi:hypothetical protein [Paractinoplanes hotanensis]|uniref:Uncharacterized protein n=1 Tax=Paractinoplanes hotanensis TaxID=2906497 RepID=A0ABT0YE93_9ACTN|nr:hypothetical protein [Actinoplanes hotanensis]MCM4084373.1 hypothetical protein [Actinoplanes hotanensis]
MAALLGGMRRYHHRHGIELGELSVVVPGDGSLTGAVFAGPAGVTDPRERVAVLHGLLLTSHVEQTQHGLSSLTPLLNRLPATVIGAASKMLTPADLRVSFSATIVSATRWAGVTVQESYLLGWV